METEKVDLGNFLSLARKIVLILEYCHDSIDELDRAKRDNKVVLPQREKTFEDFIRFARATGGWEIAAMLERCEPMRFNPAVPRFKFRAPAWEATTLGLLYREQLRELLSKYCDGRDPKYLVFERDDAS